MRGKLIASLILTCVVFSVSGAGQEVKQQPAAQLDYFQRKEMSAIYSMFQSSKPVDSCTQRHTEKPATCSCKDNSGHTFTKQAQCYSCYNPMNGQKCGGPYCYSCYTVCNPGGTVPPQNPGPC